MAVAFAALSLVGCGSANDRVAKVNFGTVDGLATTGALRIVTERKRPGYPNVVCTEPSPDYAVAFNRSTKANLTLTAAGAPAPAAAPGANGDADVTLDRKEVIAAGDGRSAAVLALRDGLYAACQSYANGVIGQDAYAMILSQYGHLLVALVGGGRADAAKTPADTAVLAKAVTLDGRRTALSTLIVACLSGNDATRLGGNARPNPLLSKGFCQRVMVAALEQATGERL